jgi:hypothetical protein
VARAASRHAGVECRGKLRIALALARNPDACRGGDRPEDGSRWWLAGREWEENPRKLINPAWSDFVRLWFACRGTEGVIAAWPDAGGVGQQAAWTVDAFGVLSAAEAEYRKTEPQ